MSNSLIKDSQTDWKYIILIVLILAVIVGGGILVWQHWLIPKRGAEIISLNEILDRVKNINSIRYQLLILSDEDLVSKQEIWREGRGRKMKARIETEPLFGEDKFIQIINFSKGFWYGYTLEKNEAKEIRIPEQQYDYKTGIEGSEDNLLESAEIIKQNNPRVIGKEVLDGKECLVVRTFTEGIEIKHWIWIEYGLPIKTIRPIETLGGKIDPSRKDKAVRENVEVNADIPDDIFELPAGVEIIPIEIEETSKTYRNEEYGF